MFSSILGSTTQEVVSVSSALRSWDNPRSLKTLRMAGEGTKPPESEGRESGPRETSCSSQESRSQPTQALRTGNDYTGKKLGNWIIQTPDGVPETSAKNQLPKKKEKKEEMKTTRKGRGNGLVGPQLHKVRTPMAPSSQEGSLASGEFMRKNR